MLWSFSLDDDLMDVDIKLIDIKYLHFDIKYLHSFHVYNFVLI